MNALIDILSFVAGLHGREGRLETVPTGGIRLQKMHDGSCQATDLGI